MPIQHRHKRARNGRPKLATSTRRSAVAATRCTPDQDAQLEADARAAGMSKSAYLYHLIFERKRPRPKRKNAPVPPPTQQTALDALTSIGRSLNTLTHRSNVAGSLPASTAHVLRGLTSVYDQHDASLTTITDRRLVHALTAIGNNLTQLKRNARDAQVRFDLLDQLAARTEDLITNHIDGHATR